MKDTIPQLNELMEENKGRITQVPAPSPHELSPHLLVHLEKAIEELSASAPGLSSTLSKQIRDVTADVYETLKQRGEEYGEDLLFLTGEEGIIIMAVWKAMRILWSNHAGISYANRKDSWRDMAGYAILCMAMMEWLEEYREQLPPTPNHDEMREIVKQRILASQGAFGLELCEHGFTSSCPEECN